MLPLVAAAVIAAAVPGTGIDALASYDGRWRLETRTIETPYSKAGGSVTVIANRCLKFMQHLACGQNVDGKDAGLIVFSFDPATSRYATLAITADGIGHSGRLEVDGARWLFPWDEERGGKMVHFRVSNVFVHPDEIAYSKEYSTDGVSWRAMETGTEHHLGRGPGAIAPASPPA